MCMLCLIWFKTKSKDGKHKIIFKKVIYFLNSEIVLIHHMAWSPSLAGESALVNWARRWAHLWAWAAGMPGTFPGTWGDHSVFSQHSSQVWCPEQWQRLGWAGWEAAGLKRTEVCWWVVRWTCGSGALAAKVANSSWASTNIVSRSN